MFIFLHLKIFQSSFFATLLQCFEWLQVQLNVQTFQERKFLHFPNCSLFFSVWRFIDCGKNSSYIQYIHTQQRKFKENTKNLSNNFTSRFNNDFFLCSLCGWRERMNMDREKNECLRCSAFIYYCVLVWYWKLMMKLIIERKQQQNKMKWNSLLVKNWKYCLKLCSEFS